MPFVMDKSKFKKEASYSNLPLSNLSEVQWDIINLPFDQNKDYQY